MPTVILMTSSPSDNVHDSDVARKLSDITARLTGKPEGYVMVCVQSGQVMTFGATQDPCAFVRLVSLGALNAETNARLSSEIASLSSAEYQVPANRLYIEFVDVKERFMFGFNGSTF